jgi:hypothetical protein
MNIEYDLAKATANLQKHGVSFDEASTALLDDNALVMEDLDSKDESRWVLVGMSDQARLLTVVYTLRKNSIRLISARKATKKESNYYA